MAAEEFYAMRVWSASKWSGSRRSGARPTVLNMRRMAGCFLVVMTFGVVMGAQQAAVGPLVRGPVDDSVLTVLRGNTHPLAVAKNDRGMAPDDLPMERMLLVLKRSPAQEAALRKLLDDQQNSASPNYHKWLTPERVWKAVWRRRRGRAGGDRMANAAWLWARHREQGPNGC